MLAFIGIDGATDCAKSLDDDFLHLGDEILFNGDVCGLIVFVDVLLETVEWKLVAILELTVGSTVLLDGVVSQVDESIIDVFQIDSKLRTTSSQVSLREKVEVLFLSEQDPNSNVKLSLMDQKRPFDVFLYYESVELNFICLLITSPLAWATINRLTTFSDALLPQLVKL